MPPSYPGTGTGPYTPYPAPVQQKRGGCSPAILIGVVIGGLVLFACVFIAALALSAPAW